MLEWWPQIVIVSITLVGLGVSLASHGKPRKPENFWITLIATAITYTLYFFGGFFDGMFQ